MKNTLSFTIDFKNAKNAYDAVYRIEKSLEIFPFVSEEEILERIETNYDQPNWDALLDSLYRLNFHSDTIPAITKQKGKVDNFILYLENYEQLKERIPLKFYHILTDVLFDYTQRTEHAPGDNFNCWIKILS